MRMTRRLALVAAAVAAALVASAPLAAAPGRATIANTYVVLYTTDASLATARLAVRAAGGVLVRENGAVGIATASSVNPRFATDVMRWPSIAAVRQSRAALRSDNATQLEDVGVV